MIPIGYSETSAINYHSHRSGSLKSRKIITQIKNPKAPIYIINNKYVLIYINLKQYYLKIIPDNKQEISCGRNEVLIIITDSHYNARRSTEQQVNIYYYQRDIYCCTKDEREFRFVPG
jgi:PHD/YefM family antitoxin component YafN of YafNO toxin-antitoxin module